MGLRSVRESIQMVYGGPCIGPPWCSARCSHWLEVQKTFGYREDAISFTNLPTSPRITLYREFPGASLGVRVPVFPERPSEINGSDRQNPLRSVGKFPTLQLCPNLGHLGYIGVDGSGRWSFRCALRECGENGRTAILTITDRMGSYHT